MINKLEVINLYNDVDISIEFSNDLNIIIGDNGAYKTTIFSIIDLLRKSNFKKLFRINFNELKLHYTYLKDNISELIIIEVDRKKPIVEVRIITEESTIVSLFDQKGIPVLEDEGLNLRTSALSSNQNALRADFDDDDDDDDDEYEIISFSDSVDNMSAVSVFLRGDKGLRLKYLPVTRYKYLSETPDRLILEREIRYSMQTLDNHISRKYLEFSNKFKETAFRELFRSDNVGRRNIGFHIVTPDDIDELVDFMESMNFSWSAQTVKELKLKYSKASIQYQEYDKIKNSEERNTFLVNMVETDNYNELFYFFEDNKQIYVLKELINLMRNWNEYKESILRKKIEYLEIVRKYFSYNKKLEFELNGNEIQITKINRFGDKNQISMQQFSSGERAILQILSEQILRVDDHETVLIIDEPELSLHVEWQESLLEDFMKNNANLQIIIATHSPTILEKFNEGRYIIQDYFTSDRDGVQYER